MAAVSDLAHGLEQLHTSRAQAVGLGNGAFTLLGVVAESGDAGTTISAAADKLGVRPQGLSSTVRELAKAGLLARKVDRSDARARRLHITTLGRERLADDGGLYSQLVTEVLAQVPHPSIAKLVISRLDLAFRRVLAKPAT